MTRTATILAFIVAVSAIAPHALAQRRQAERALKNGEFAEARAHVEELLNERPDDYRGYDLLARIHAQQMTVSEGDEYLMHVEAMATAYRRVVELRARSSNEVNHTLLQAYQNAFMGGVGLYQNAAEVSADSADAQSDLYVQSSQQFQAAALIMPDSLDPYLNWAFAAIAAGRDLGAVVPLQNAIMRTAGAVPGADSLEYFDQLRLAAEIGTLEIDWYDYIGRIYMSSNHAEEAVAVLEEGTKVFSNNEELQGLLLNAYAVAGMNDLAIERYRERVEALPSDRITRYNLGSLLLQAEEYEEAIVHLKAAVELDNKHTDSFYNLGAAYINQATDLQAQASALDDSLRAVRDTLEEEDIDRREQEIFELQDEKITLMSMAIPYLEHALALAEIDESRESVDICRALYQVYAQNDQMDKVEDVKDCAGF